MNLDGFDPVSRMTQYFYLMSSGGYDSGTGASIRQIVKRLKYPIHLVRYDYSELYKRKMIYPISDDVFDDSFEEDLFEIDLRLGLADDVIMIDIWDDFEGYQDRPYRLPLNSSEYEVIQLFYEKERAYIAPVLRIKDSFRSTHTPSVYSMLKIATDAVRGETELLINLIGIGEKRILPQKIFYDATDNDYGIVTIENRKPKVYPLSLIRSLKDTGRKGCVRNTSALEVLHQLWGMEFMNDKIHARVRFYDEANVFNKVRRDTANRKYANLNKKNGCLVFEDDIYGYDVFKSWVLSFGFSAIVEKPDRLRNEIIDEMRRRLKRI